jgi:phage portal protein BeeE
MSVLKWGRPREEERSGLVDLFESWAGAKPKEKLGDDFRSYVEDGYKRNGVIFGVILARMSLFTEVQFTFRNRLSKDLYGTPALGLLENPWPNGTTGELLARIEQDVSLAGNSYTFRAAPDRLQRLQPDWVTIVGTPGELLGYAYTPGGGPENEHTRLLLPQEVAHYSPIPDPRAAFRGMSWLTPVLGEVQSDAAMTAHKQMFFERAATPNLLVKSPKKLDLDSWQRVRDQLEQRHEGLHNAYRTMILEDGADATVIGSNMQAISFDTIQAAGENRIAAAGGVPGIIVGLKEGLQAATYSNYAQAMRRFVDLWARPQWRTVCSALEHLVAVPGGSQLWYDLADIGALRDSEMDAADIMLKKTMAIVNLVRSGYEGAEAAKVVETGEGLESLPHTGEVYYPGAQAYTTPGEVPAGEPGDVTLAPDKGAPAANGNGAANGKMPPQLKVKRDDNGLLEGFEFADAAD